jgi:thiamine-phosphate pyrophosphorylase
LALTLRHPLHPVSTRNNPLTQGKSPLLCYVTDRKSLGAAGVAEPLVALIQKIEDVAAAGVDWVQIREKDLPAGELASLTRHALAIAAKLSAKRTSAVRVLVNDRLDVAIAERASGVHLGEKSLPVAEAKRLVQTAVRKQAVDESFLIGASCHSLETAQAAQRDGADYVFFGPVFATPSKVAFGPSQGLVRLTQVCRQVTIPVLAIGGIMIQSAASCIETGAAGLAAIRLYQDALDPVSTVNQLRQVATNSRRQPPADRPSD